MEDGRLEGAGETGGGGKEVFFKPNSLVICDFIVIILSLPLGNI